MKRYGHEKQLKAAEPVDKLDINETGMGGHTRDSPLAPGHISDSRTRAHGLKHERASTGVSELGRARERSPLCLSVRVSHL